MPRPAPRSPLPEPTRVVHVYMRADVAREGTIADHIDHARARRWWVEAGCFVVEDGVGTHWYPLTSVARWTIERADAR